MRAVSGSDWTRTPSAMFAAGVLGLASIGGLAWSWNRSVERERIGEQALAGGAMSERSVLPQSLGVQDPALAAQHAPEIGTLSAIKRIDVNSANAAELDLLPGIGPALASRIITERQENGAFGSVEDLARVKGIGPKTVEKLRDRVIVSESASVRASVDEDG